MISKYIIKNKIKKAVSFFGLNIKRRSCCLDINSARSFYIKEKKVDLLIDVGASDGRYSMDIRDGGYSGQIESFEPLKYSFLRLKNNSNGDLNWNFHNIALSNFTGTSELKISQNLSSSSLLDMGALHEKAAPSSKHISTQKIEVRELDSFHFEGQSIYLKIDTQGLELNVLRGAGSIVNRCKYIELEVSFSPLYEGQPSHMEVLETMDKLNFRPVFIENVLCKEDSSELLQANIIFQKNSNF